MVAITGKLTAVAIKAGEGKPGKLFDGGGLYLLTKPSGGRYGQMKYRHGGKEGPLAFGVYPEVSLAETRRRRDEARVMLRDGANPAGVKRACEAAGKVAAANTFEAIGREWLDKQRAKLAPATLAKAEWMLADNAFPWLGSRPIGGIDAPELLAVLRRIE